MSKAFQLPYSNEQIAESSVNVERLASALDAARVKHDAMLRDNREAEFAEAVRKARVMTATMRATLERLAKGELIKIQYPTWVKNPCRIFIGKDILAKSVHERLLLAGFVEYSGKNNEYTISDLGREALAAASK